MYVGVTLRPSLPVYAILIPIGQVKPDHPCRQIRSFPASAVVLVNIGAREGAKGFALPFASSRALPVLLCAGPGIAGCGRRYGWGDNGGRCCIIRHGGKHDITDRRY